MAENALPGQGSAVRAGPGQVVPVLQIPLGGAVAPTNCQVETALPEVSPQVELVLPEVSVAESALTEEGNTTAPPGPASEVPASGSLCSWEGVEAEPDSASGFGGSTVASCIVVDYDEF